MTGTPDPFRERAHRLAETFVEDGEATVVALLADAAEPGASWGAAAALAGAAAARRRTLLVNLAGAGSGLDGFLEVEGREGLEAVRSGERKLSEAAVSPPGRDFLYLPSGDPGPGEPTRPTEDRGVLRALRRLADKIREARGLLLLYLEAGALPASLAGDLVDGAVPLAGADPHLPDSVPLLGRLAAPEQEPGAEEDFLPGLTGGEVAGFGAGDAAEGPAEGPGAPQGPDEAAEPAGPGEPDEPASTGGEEPGGGFDEIDLPEPPETEEPVAAGGSGEASSREDGPPDEDLEETFVEPEPPDEEAEEDELEDAFVEPEPPAGGAPTDEQDAAGADDGDGGWRRHRRSAGFPWAKIAAGAAAILLLGGGWWWFAGRAADAGGEAAVGGPGTSGRAVASEDTAAVDTAAAPATDATDEETDEEEDGDAAARAGAGEGAPPIDAVGSAPELTHSVLVASFSTWPSARERAEGLRSERGGTWFVAPTPVRGTVYWRLFAGALSGPEAGRTLMEELVRDGVKDEVRAWDVRPASVAWRLGVEASRSAAEERASKLRGQGIPAYVLPAAADSDTAWQVYAGAFESREAAARLGEMLEAADVESELVARRGEEGDGR